MKPFVTRSVKDATLNKLYLLTHSHNSLINCDVFSFSGSSPAAVYGTLVTPGDELMFGGGLIVNLTVASMRKSD